MLSVAYLFTFRIRTACFHTFQLTVAWSIETVVLLVVIRSSASAPSGFSALTVKLA
jgi:hypothetical protein